MSVFSFKGHACALLQPLHLTGPLGRTTLSGPRGRKGCRDDPQSFSACAGVRGAAGDAPTPWPIGGGGAADCGMGKAAEIRNGLRRCRRLRRSERQSGRGSGRQHPYRRRVRRSGPGARHERESGQRTRTDGRHDGANRASWGPDRWPSARPPRRGRARSCPRWQRPCHHSRPGRTRRKRSRRTTVRSLCAPGADTGVLVRGNVRARSDHRTVRGLLCLILPRRRTTGRCHP